MELKQKPIKPGIALWNLSCFAQTLILLVEREAAIVALNEYHSFSHKNMAR